MPSLISRHGDVLSTPEIARLCGVAPRTVCKWIDKGYLTGYRVGEEDGTGPRRVERGVLRDFLRQRKMRAPLLKLEGQEKAVLVACTGMLGRAFGAEWLVQNVSSLFAAGIALHEGPSVLILNSCLLGVNECCAAAEYAASRDHSLRTLIIMPEDYLLKTGHTWQDAGYSWEALKAPVGAADLAALLAVDNRASSLAGPTSNDANQRHAPRSSQAL